MGIFPGIMMASDIDRDLFTINVIVEPQLILDLVLIEPMRQPMGPLAGTFLRLLENETARISARLATVPATVRQARGRGGSDAGPKAERSATILGERIPHGRPASARSSLAGAERNSPAGENRHQGASIRPP